MPEFYDAVDPLAGQDSCNCGKETQVWQVMTPIVLSIDADASLAEVVEELLVRKVHRLFVTESQWDANWCDQCLGCALRINSVTVMSTRKE